MALSEIAEQVIEKLRMANSPVRLGALHSLLPNISKYELHRCTQELVLQKYVAEGRLGFQLLIGEKHSSIQPIPSPENFHPAIEPESNAIIKTTHSKTTPNLPSMTKSRWQVFRRLCQFYAECIRLEERGAVSAYADREGELFLSLPGPIDFDALSATRGFALGRTDQLESFITRGRTRRRHPSLFLGGPVAVTVRQDKDTKELYRILRPIFILQVNAEITSSAVYLKFQNASASGIGGVEINHEWLEHRCRDPAARKEFLVSVGLLDPAEWEDGAGEPLIRITSSIGEATRRMRLRHPNWWKETGDLSRPATAPLLREVNESGIYNRVVLIQQPELKFSGRLHAELLKIANNASDEELDKSALTQIFPYELLDVENNADACAGENSHKSPSMPPPSLRPLNPEQRDAVIRSARDPLLVVTGPPGTGKSVVVQHSMIANALAGKSVLFASRNHEALRAVVPHLNAIVEPEQLVCWPGQKVDGGARSEWYRVMAALLARPRRPDVLESLEIAKLEREECADKIATAESAVNAWMESREQLARFEHQIAEARIAFSPDVLGKATNAPQLPSLDQISGAISSITPPDGRGVRSIVARLLWRIRIKKSLRMASVIDNAYNEHFGRIDCRPLVIKAELVELVTALQEWKRIASLVEVIKAQERLVTKTRLGPSTDILIDRLKLCQRRNELCTKRALNLLAESAAAMLTPQQRTRFAELSAALQNAAGAPTNRQLQRVERSIRAEFPTLVNKFPLWTVTNLSVHSALPLAPASFDLLIVDEASQCDIGSVIPLLYRARRAMIVGDPMQLRHVSRISADLEYRIRLDFDLVEDSSLERYTHRVNSMYMVASSSPKNSSTVQLVGHFRSHSEIAQLINRSFYSQTLDVMTNEDSLRGPTAPGWRRFGCEWIHVDGDSRAATSGCYSPGEIEEVIHQLHSLEASNFQGTVGVVTPFRVQANRISDRAATDLRRETLDRWQFIANTADAFQGGERDIIIFSLVAAANMPSGSRLALSSSPNRFNVAISRARAHLRIVGDREWAKTSGIQHIKALVLACSNKVEENSPPIREDLIGPVWEPLFADALREAGLPVRQQYPACGRFLDIALIQPSFKLDVEVDGECHRDVTGRRKLDDIYRDQILEAAGWKIQRFWVYQIREDLMGCVDKVRQLWLTSTQTDKEIVT